MPPEKQSTEILRELAVVTIGLLTLAVYVAGFVALWVLPGELARLCK